MANREPLAELDPQFSDVDASPTPWSAASDALAKAEIYWVTTVRLDRRPHVTPLIAIWQDDALYFCTGGQERKARNIARNAHCAITTGCNSYGEGLDLVIEGDAVQVSDEALLQHLADAYVSKYGSNWRFAVRDGAFVGDAGNVAQVYEVKPVTVFGFGKGTFSQTRWRF
ncbi:MAG: pyridoxamine 5'-phosphate oxidase family protein [Thermomicrobiales bacterium]